MQWRSNHVIFLEICSSRVRCLFPPRRGIIKEGSCSWFCDYTGFSSRNHVIWNMCCDLRASWICKIDDTDWSPLRLLLLLVNKVRSQIRTQMLFTGTVTITVVYPLKLRCILYFQHCMLLHGMMIQMLLHSLLQSFKLTVYYSWSRLSIAIVGCFRRKLLHTRTKTHLEIISKTPQQNVFSNTHDELSRNAKLSYYAIRG